MLFTACCMHIDRYSDQKFNSSFPHVPENPENFTSKVLQVILCAYPGNICHQACYLLPVMWASSLSTELSPVQTRVGINFTTPSLSLSLSIPASVYTACNLYWIHCHCVSLQCIEKIKAMVHSWEQETMGVSRWWDGLSLSPLLSPYPLLSPSVTDFLASIVGNTQNYKC